MDNLTALMEQIDLISKSIPEGNYLKMCTSIKNLHADIKEMDPPRIEMRRPIPFTPVIEYDMWAENQAALIYMEEQIKMKEKQLRQLKSRKYITEVMKRDAIKERAQQLDIGLGSYTMDDLRAKGVRIPNERAFYKGYIDRQNILTNEVRVDLELEIQELSDQVDDIYAQVV